VSLADGAEFEIALDGKVWRDALAEEGLKRGQTGSIELPLVMALGDTQHATRLTVETTARGDQVSSLPH